MRRRARYWSTRFGRFVSDVGVAELTRAFATQGDSIRGWTVYAWIEGKASPLPRRRQLLIHLSHGKLRPEDLDRHRELVRGRLAGRPPGPANRASVGSRRP